MGAFRTERRAAAVIGGIGLALALVHALHVVGHDKPPLATLVGGVFPLVLSLVIVYAGYWTARSESNRAYVDRLVQWTALGGVGMGALVGTIAIHQYLSGHLPEDAAFQLATAATGGALGGFLIGVYDARMRRRSDRIRSLQRATGEFVVAETKRDVCEQVVQFAASELDMPLTGAWLYDETTDALEPVAITDEGRDTFDDSPTYEGGDSLTWDAFESGDVRVYADVRDHPNRYNPETIVGSEIVVSLGSHGVLNIGSRETDAFDDVDVSTAELLASATSAVLDRTEREAQLRAKREALETQNERLDEFASIVSHDLRNPLTIAQGNLELAAEECNSNALEEIELAHRRMETLITDLLQLARAGKTIDETDRVSLQSAATRAWQMVAADEATLAIEPSSVELEADERRLNQLLENVFRNAIDHGGPAVTVRVTALEGEAGFAVEDDGPGIPPADRDRVFDSGYTTRENGTGLGLVTVQRIAEAHGWSVDVTDGEDGGARFEIRTSPSAD
ncbi:histidine kinase [Natrarchaeobius oligotrophus]|uniref:histidine kinase n=2 Tax=Natrarchaeobius TaxID=2501796 RepID=A0A3N6MWW9_NATCH|nr:histidine kinase [Natrarchaeobius chitinivorans]